MIARPATASAAHIKNICRQRGISAAVHFTRIENLSSILDQGLLSRVELQKRNIRAIYNDAQRLDGYPNAICLSISFPNYRMFYRYRVNSQSKWVVIALDASVLWEKDCAFCITNAASSFVRRIPLDQRKLVSAFEGLFGDYNDGTVHVRRSDLYLPASYPTNPQAEVLAFEALNRDYIKSIVVETRQDALKVQNILKGQIYFPIVVNSAYFRQRDDYEFWKTERSKNSDRDFITEIDDEDLPF